MAYNDILLDSVGDLRLDGNNDLILAESLVQEINVQLRWFKGEWPFDETKGTDWFDTVFVKNPDDELIRQMVEQILYSFDEISEVESVAVEADARERKAAITWRAATKTRERIESEVVLWGSSTA